MATEKIYSESEVAEIIRRAGEIQEEKSEHGYVPGVNTNELAQIAQEVGIQHEFLEVALREHSSESMGVSRKKSTRTESIERVVPVEISPEDFDVITEDLKVIPAMSLSGSKSSGLSQFGRTVTGQVHEAWDNPHFKLNSRGGRTKIEVWTDKSAALALSFLWMLPLIFSAGAFKLGGPIAGIASMLFVIASAFATYRVVLAKSSAAVQRVADKLHAAVLMYGESLEQKTEADSSMHLEEPTNQNLLTSGE
jgi:hypothetical protein